jgi:hypothetical protein
MWTKSGGRETELLIQEPGGRGRSELKENDIKGRVIRLRDEEATVNPESGGGGMFNLELGIRLLGGIRGRSRTEALLGSPATRLVSPARKKRITIALFIFSPRYSFLPTYEEGVISYPSRQLSPLFDKGTLPAFYWFRNPGNSVDFMNTVCKQYISASSE